MSNALTVTQPANAPAIYSDPDFALADDPRPTSDLSPDERQGRLDQNWGDYARTANPRTLATYQAGVAKFTAWCDERGHPYTFPLDPVSPRLLAVWIDDRAQGLSVASFKGYLAAINKMHSLAGWPKPADAQPVTNAMKRLIQEKGSAQKQAPALRYDTLAPLLADLDAKGDLMALRDAALISVAYDTMCRRSEVAALDLKHIRSTPEGHTAYIAKSKTDQAGAGAHKHIAPDTYARVIRWVNAATIESGPLWLPLSCVDSPSPGKRLSGRDVARVIQRRAAPYFAHLPEDARPRFSGHSTRVGSTQDQYAAGIDGAATQQAGGWSSPVMPNRYARQLKASDSGAAKLAQLQGRG